MENKKSSANNQGVINNDINCCLLEIFGTCSLDPRQKLHSWPSSSLLIADLTADMTEHLQHLNVIQRNHHHPVTILERDLILNRLYQLVDVSNIDLYICPLHRYTFGIGWRTHNQCYHNEHKATLQQGRVMKRRRSTSAGAFRVASFHLVEKIVGFPYGGKICDKHRKKLYMNDTPSIDDFNINYMNDESDQSDVSNMEVDSSVQSFKNYDMSEYNRAQQILSVLRLSPIQSQCKKSLTEQTPGALRRITAKLRKAVATTTSTLARSIAPGQRNLLINLSGLDSVMTTRSSATQGATTIDEDYLSYLVDMYRAYEAKNLPYNEKIRLLSLIPESWNLSYDNIINYFGCTQHAIKAARSLKQASSTPLHIDERPSITRQRCDPAQIDHFLTWLIETKLLVSIAWGITSLKLENGSTLTVPRQVLQAKRSHAVHQYKEHCSEVNFKPLSDRKLLYLLENINTRPQKAISGLDDFVVAATEGWESLTNILPKLSISEREKFNLQGRIENCCLYVKTSYALKCSSTSECLSHCTTFALSQAKNSEFSETCKHKHHIYCKECLNVFELFDDLERIIEQGQESEQVEEIKYDFNMARESIFEIIRHRVRMVQQDTAKAHMLSSMSTTTAYHIIDWAQKILPHGFREGQTAYFGKKGMSALVGCFTFYDTSGSLITRTYILCLTRCEQTEQATLSGGYLILQQFHIDYPHVTSIIKRSDNASILAGHATPEGEWFLSKLAGLTLIVRDYSEIQSGKDVCDRIVGAAKMRMKAYLHAGHDISDSSDIKRGMEYCGGVKGVKIATAEILDGVTPINGYTIPEISMIRSIVYENDHMILRKASNIGRGHIIGLSGLNVPINMQVVETFERFNSNTNSSLHTGKKRKDDRKYTSFFFCSNDSCIESFQSEEDLIVHESIGRHTTKENHFSSNDTAKVLLFDKMRGMNHANSNPINTTTTTSSILHLPKHFSFVEQIGWGLRTHKSSRRLDINVKNFIKKIYEQEKFNGRKVTAEEYVQRIRSARHPDGVKIFTPSQYLTISQVRNQLRQLAKNKKSSNSVNALSIGSETNSQSQIEQTSIISSSSTTSSRPQRTTQTTPATYIELDSDLSDSDLDDEDLDAIDEIQWLQDLREQLNE